ncbi:MAG: chromosome segregation protein [Patescibacteria group bacterium]|jgi:chromosome segregation protein
MTYIKEMVVHGFKSFARKTDIPLTDSMNVIVGPNGSGKSNITDALCFVLGRLSIKSIRAAKAANLLFSGNKIYKGANEAYVELVFDNSDKTFGSEHAQVSIRRVVRKNGTSVYKINGVTKTRQDLLELLGQGGIDPNGFNIVLQGEIQALVKASSDERRKILEDVAGISIYESRKERSLRELEKAEEKLKEVRGVLKERNSYLKNLEREKADATNFQKTEALIKDCKKTLIFYATKEKEKEIWGVEKLIENNTKEITKVKKEVSEKSVAIEDLEIKIEVMDRRIAAVTHGEQDVLHKEISDLRADLAGLRERNENFKRRIAEGERKINELDAKKLILEKEIGEIKTASPDIKKQQDLHKKLSEEFDLLEQQRRRVYVLRSDLVTLEHKRDSRSRFLDTTAVEMNSLERSIADLLGEVKHGKTVRGAEDLRVEIRRETVDIHSDIVELKSKVLEIEKRCAILGEEIRREEEMESSVLGLESCPVCLQEVCDEHKEKIGKTAKDRISAARSEEGKLLEEKDGYLAKVAKMEEKVEVLQGKVQDIGLDIVKLTNISTRKEEVKKVTESRVGVDVEIAGFTKEIGAVVKEQKSLESVEEKYDEVRMRLQDMSFANIDVDSEIGIKQREISRLGLEKKAVIRDFEESSVELKKAGVMLTEKEQLLIKKEHSEKEMFLQSKKLFDEKGDFEDTQKVLETDIIGLQYSVRSFEEKIHNNKIQMAQLDAQISSLKEDVIEFEGAEVLKVPIPQVKERLSKAQFRISQLGNVNLRALEVYDQVLEQVRLIEEKVVTIDTEQLKIMDIIAEIDRKKKKAFMTTFTAVNELFARNYSGLSHKGEVSLELVDKKDPFNGGVNIIVKMSRGRYFDIASLSGGEKTMISLALIFAIQEFKPYSFYIFDEIDAALDKHNSELLAGLIKKYMKTGQYIIITHNDTLISGASTLYGVSMQENISKVISLKV